jgi:uncharacterized Tic20 family protein
MSFEHSVPVPPLAIARTDKALIILCHLSSLLGIGIVLPLIVWLVVKNENTFVSDHAKEALNFHLSLLIYTLANIPLVFIGIGLPIFALIALFGLIFAIIAAVKASDGVFYRYPLTIRLIR